MDPTPPNQLSTTTKTAPTRKPRGALTIVQGGSPRTPPPRRLALTNLRAVRREMATVYWLARDGRMEVSDAAKLSFILSSIGKVLMDSDLEGRLRALEHLEDNR